MSINPNHSPAQITLATPTRRPSIPSRHSLEASQSDNSAPSPDLLDDFAPAASPTSPTNHPHQIIERAIQNRQNLLKQQFVERGQLEVTLLNQMIEQKQQHPISQNLLEQQLKAYQRTAQSIQKTLETLGHLLALHPQAEQTQSTMQTLQLLQTDYQTDTPEAVRQKLNERLPDKSSTLANIQTYLPSPGSIAKLADQDTDEWSEWLWDIHERWFAPEPAPAPSNPFLVPASKKAP